MSIKFLKNLEYYKFKINLKKINIVLKFNTFVIRYMVIGYTYIVFNPFF